MPASWPDCISAGVETGTTQESTTDAAAAASARLARLPMPVSTEPLTLQMIPPARDRGNFHGAIKATGFGRIKRDDLCRALFDDLNDVVRVPCALVGHHGRIDGTGHFGKPSDAFRS